MRLIVVIVFLTTLKTYSQDNSLTGNWVAVDWEPIGKSFISIYTGLIFSFDKDSVKMTTVLSNKDTILSFKLKGKRLLIAGEKFGVIKKITNDSLILISNKNRRTTFRKIDPRLTEKTSINLTANPWYLYNRGEQGFKQRIVFYDTLTRQGGWRVCFRQTPGLKFKSQEIMEWSLKTIGTDIVIAIELDWGGPQTFYQVTKVSNDNLELKNLSGTDDRVIIMEKSSPRLNHEALFSLITSKKWDTENILSYATQSDEPIQILDSTIYLEGFINFEDSTLIKLEELLEKQLSMKFDSTQTFELLVNDKPFQKGTWQFSLDGEYIILDNGLRPEDYIEIVELTENYLTIGKQDELKFGNDNRSTIYYYKLRLD